MIRKYILLLVSILVFTASYSQDSELESIKELVDTYKARDSLRVQYLLRYTKYTSVQDDNESLGLINEALEISEEINNQNSLSNSYSVYSNYLVRKGEYSSALQYADKAKEIQTKQNDIEGLVLTNKCLASIYNHLDKPKEAIEINLQNLELLKNRPNDANKAGIHFYLAKSYQELSDYPNAINHYNKAKNIAESLNFVTGIAIANSSLGTLEVQRGNYIKGVEYLEESLKFYEDNKQLPNIAHTSIELSRAYDKMGDIEKAISLNSKAIDIYEKQNNLKNLKNAYLNQSNYYTTKMNFKKSNFYLIKHYIIKDSIFSKDNVRVIEEMQVKYETEKAKNLKAIADKEKLIAIEESKDNRNLFLVTLAITALILLSSLYYFDKLETIKKADIVKLELQETQKRLSLEKKYRYSELKALKSQMNPHFIFNALNSIQDYIVLNQKNLASDYLGKFADLIRNYLHYSDIGFISIGEEVRNLKLYLELEKLRFEDDLNYIIEIDNMINSDMELIPTMIIQPYIENALKHGLLHKKTDRLLNIFINKTSDDIITCIIEDNGIGREKAKEINKRNPIKHKSFALNATLERLDLLNYGKDKKIGVIFTDLTNEDSSPGGTRVEISIPFTYKI